MPIIFFVLGTVLGSAASALIYRLPRHISWSRGRSICPKCKHTLEARDLIPLLSYLLTGGKCRYCHKDIGIKYFLLEAALGSVFLGIALLPTWDLSAKLFLGLIAWTTLIVAIMDWETQLVSEAVVVVWLAAVIGLKLTQGVTWGNLLMGVVVGSVLIGLVWGLSKGRAMGFGDVEIAAVMGAWLEWPKILVGIWLAFVVGAVVGVTLILGKEKKMKSQIAFGPFLVIGSWLAYIWGDKILSLVMGIYV